MKRFAIIAGLSLALLAPQSAQARLDEIISGFNNPPAECRPRVWWHWMNGNVTKDGIRKDLLWMKEAGVGGVQVFDAGLNISTVVPERLSYMSEGWKDAFNYAAELADSLGFEFAIACAGGWSDTGGPWVSNEQAMKTLNWKQFDVIGGRTLDRPLPEPNRIAGKYLTHSFFGTHKPEYDFYRDIAVVAVRVPDYDIPMEELGAVFTASDGSSLDALHDGDLNDVCKVAPGSDDKAWIEVSFPKPVTVRAFFTAKKDDYTARRGRHWEVSDDGVNYTKIDAVFPELELPFVTIDIPASTGKHFRIVAEKPGEALDYTELRLHTATRVNLDTEKAAFFINCGVRDFHPTPAFADATPKEDVIDITAFCKDGRIRWDVPEGRWRIFRFGYTLRGRRNNPASPEATGLESDKLSAKATEDYYHSYLDKYNSATGGKVGKVLTHLMLDSYEAGCQTWTDNMPAEFRARRSYDLMQWLPALAGQIIGSSEETDRFLQDWRRTIGEMMVEYHYDALAPILKEYGLKRYTEFHESGRAFPADGMAVKKNADIPMGAVWTRSDGLADQKYMADIRESASVAHIWGQNITAAESFTTDGYVKAPDGTLLSWNMTPERMKGTADLAMASGLNSFVIHCSVHQPVDDKVPGLSLAQYGLWFQRHETWAHEASSWTAYLTRSSFLLRQGRFAADVAYLMSESVNASDRFNKDVPQVPEGYAYDFVNIDAVNGSGNFAYKAILIDPEAIYMSCELLRGLKARADKGVIIAGSEPRSFFGLGDREEEFRSLVNDIWHSGRSNVVPFDAAAQALAASGCPRDVDFGKDSSGLSFVHRHLQDGELYFITSTEEKAERLNVSFNVSGRKPLVLHADSGKIEDADYHMENGRTIVSLDMGIRDAQFVLFGEETAVPCFNKPSLECAGESQVSGSWKVSLKGLVPFASDKLELLSDSKIDDVRYYSGTATYSTSFKVRRLKDGDRIILSLGKVFNMARVRVNGVDCGLAWKAPFEVDITEAVRKGTNTLEIDVTNSWANRIIGDAQPGAAPVTWIEPNPYGPDSPLTPSGLGGPVVVKNFRIRD